ncbi:MAG: nucleotidyltransferase family protein [Clostridia bacterium]|nr:nucleotidyltransferase family protein [Clostridia bacterium]
MNFCAIICEFNPLTNGHKHLIEQAKKQTGLPILAIMSGDFVQRGETAILDKYTRSEIAIECGCDIVLELPTIFAISPAENFAFGAIKCLKELDCISHLAFGVENSNLETIESLARFMIDKKSVIDAEIQKQKDNKHSHNRIMQEVIIKLTNNRKYAQILKGANNILALEYIKASIKQGFEAKFVAIQRTDNGHNSKQSNSQFLSATAIRELAIAKKTEQIKNFVPAKTYKKLKQQIFDYDAFSKSILAHLRNQNAERIKQTMDVGFEGLENKILSESQKQTSFDATIKGITSKRYRSSRIKRICLASYLGITKNLYNTIIDAPATLKVLAIKKENKAMLKTLSLENAKLATTSKDYSAPHPSLSLDLYASNAYNAFDGKPHNHDIKTGILFI